MSKRSGVKGGTPQQVYRRKRVINMLEKQLAVGTKTQKGTRDVKIPLEEIDISRINKELSNLKLKI